MPVPEIRITLPAALRELGDSFSSGRPGPSGPCGPSELMLPAGDVRELLAELARRHPQVYVRLCDERGEPRPHINVFVNNDHVRARAGLDTLLATGDVVTILPAVSGG